MFRQDFTCPALLKDLKEALPIRGYHPLWRAFPDASGCLLSSHWPGPRSLVTTNGVSVDVLSSGYLDISVPRVRSLAGDLTVGFPHSEIHGSKIARISPRLIATCYVLHRLSVPRHPPNALQRLITKLSCTGTSPAHDVSAFSNLRYMNYTSYLPERAERRIPEHAG